MHRLTDPDESSRTTLFQRHLSIGTDEMCISLLKDLKTMIVGLRQRIQKAVLIGTPRIQIVILSLFVGLMILP